MVKKKIKKPVILILLASIVVLISISVIGCTDSGDASQSLEDYPMVVQKLAQEFELDPEKVQDVLEEARENSTEDMKKRFEEKTAEVKDAIDSRFEIMLEKAVEEGEITSKQKEEILAKKTEIAQNIEGLKDLPPEERRASFQELRENIKEWAENNDLDLKFFKEPKQPGPGKRPADHLK